MLNCKLDLKSKDVVISWCLRCHFCCDLMTWLRYVANSYVDLSKNWVFTLNIFELGGKLTLAGGCPRGPEPFEVPSHWGVDRWNDVVTWLGPRKMTWSWSMLITYGIMNKAKVQKLKVQFLIKLGVQRWSYFEVEVLMSRVSVRSLSTCSSGEGDSSITESLIWSKGSFKRNVCLCSPDDDSNSPETQCPLDPHQVP